MSAEGAVVAGVAAVSWRRKSMSCWTEDVGSRVIVSGRGSRSAASSDEGLPVVVGVVEVSKAIPVDG